MARYQVPVHQEIGESEQRGHTTCIEQERTHNMTLTCGQTTVPRSRRFCLVALRPACQIEMTDSILEREDGRDLFKNARHCRYM